VSHGRATLQAVHGKAEPARRADHQPGLRRRESYSLQPAGGGKEARSQARAPRARRRPPRIGHEGSDGRC
jgi:hypothetical protein